MSRLVFFLLALVYALGSSAQSLKVMNETNLEGIADVLVYSSNSVITGQTDASGIIDISGFGEEEVLNFQHPSFQRETIAYADLSSNDFKVYLKERIIEIGELVISANKWEEDRSEIPNEILSISPRQIEFRNPQTAADLLEGSGQVFVQRSQLGGGSPMMRGFGANSVLIVFDGIRMNNAIFRGGNLQNVIQVDPNVLEGAEVVFGPGSVIYGSDALGGVMDFHTLDPKLESETASFSSGQIFGRYASANHEKTSHIHFNLAGKKLASLTSITFSDYDDLVTGSNRTEEFPDFGKRPWFVRRINGEDIIRENDNVNEQLFSGYHQYNVLQKFRYRPGDNLDLEYQFYYTSSSNIPRYDRLIEVRDSLPRSAQWYYGPQQFMMNALKLTYFQGTRYFDQARMTLSYQLIEESRHDRQFQDPALRHRTENLNIVTANFDFDKVLSASNQLFYGFEFTHNDVASSAFEENVDTGDTGPASTRYPDGGSDYTSFAAYISDKWSISERWILTTGARYSFVALESRFEDDTFFDFPFDRMTINNGAINGSAGLVFKPGERTKLNAMVSTGFRSPNVDDAGKVFDSEPGNVVVPNEDLKPEFTYNFETGVSHRIGDHVQFDAVVFYTLLRDAIVRRDFTFNGQDSILYDGELSRVQAEVNQGKAHIYGFSVSIKSDISDRWSLFSSLTLADGEDQVDNVPLRHTTPLFGQTSLTYSARKIKGEVFFRYNGKRSFEDLPPEEQGKTHLYTADGSLAWFTANLRGSYQISNALQVNGAVENLLNTHYRPYSSGISAPGRNFILALRASF